MYNFYDDVEVDIDNAWYLLTKGKTKGPAYGPVYPYTNENLRGYLPQFDVRDKNVLTVSASGDHFLNLALAGAKDITTFDINKMAFYWQELKKAGVLTLSPTEFKNFFSQSKSQENFFDPNSYKKIRAGLEGAAKQFWDSVVQFNPSKERLCRSAQLYEEAGLPAKSNPYMDENNYFLLRKKLSTINTKFFHCDIRDLPRKACGQYDAVFTSNICDHVGFSYREFIEKDFPAVIAPGGFAQVFHDYHGARYFDSSGVKLPDLSQKKMHYERRFFPALRSPSLKGSVISLHKD